MDIFMQIMWFGTGIAIIVAGVFANRSRLARYVGRVALFLLFAIAGALMHFIAPGVRPEEDRLLRHLCRHRPLRLGDRRMACRVCAEPGPVRRPGRSVRADRRGADYQRRAEDPGWPDGGHCVPSGSVALRRHPARLDTCHGSVPGVAATRRAACSSNAYTRWPFSGPDDNHCFSVSPGDTHQRVRGTASAQHRGSRHLLGRRPFRPHADRPCGDFRGGVPGWMTTDSSAFPGSLNRSSTEPIEHPCSGAASTGQDLGRDSRSGLMTRSSTLTNTSRSRPTLRPI